LGDEIQFVHPSSADVHTQFSLQISLGFSGTSTGIHFHGQYCANREKLSWFCLPIAESSSSAILNEDIRNHSYGIDFRDMMLGLVTGNACFPGECVRSQFE
jgi:hypothetical protein